ncbi:MAG: single-stranded DNA-binding protein, partial [Cyanobacteriota bacterium]
VTRQDGVKEKRAELTLARLHPIGATAPAAPAASPAAALQPTPVAGAPGRRGAAKPGEPQPMGAPPPSPPAPVWNTSPLVPDDLGDGEDEIPF